MAAIGQCVHVLPGGLPHSSRFIVLKTVKLGPERVTAITSLVFLSRRIFVGGPEARSLTRADPLAGRGAGEYGCRRCFRNCTPLSIVLQLIVSFERNRKTLQTSVHFPLQILALALL